MLRVRQEQLDQLAKGMSVPGTSLIVPVHRPDTTTPVFRQSVLTIREEQMLVVAEARFTSEMAGFLRTEFEEAAQVPWPELKQSVWRQISNAMKYGLKTEQQVAVYVTTAWLMGDDFNVEYGDVQETLCSKDLQADEKTAWLEMWVADAFEDEEEGD